MRMNVIIWNKAKREMDFAYVWCGEYFGSLSVRPHFKLIYYVDEARAELHIVDFWDMRRDTARLVDDLDV